MKTFETTLTGTEGLIDGIVNVIENATYKEEYRFDSLDDTLHLIIAKNDDGKWIRLAGSEPYLSSWTDELADKISRLFAANL